jgi:hypothetical protein
MEDRTTGALNLPAHSTIYFLAATDADDEAFTADFFPGFAGRLLPNEPLNIFPFLVFLSPLPITFYFAHFALFPKVTKSSDTSIHMPGNGASLFGAAQTIISQTVPYLL